MHHSIYRSNGSTESQPKQGLPHCAAKFAPRLRQLALRCWPESRALNALAWNLKNVRNHPRYAEHRWAYLKQSG
jgi:hypothetical protein